MNLAPCKRPAVYFLLFISLLISFQSCREDEPKIKTFNFHLGVFTYNQEIKNFELTDATVIITSSENILFDKSVLNATNNIIVQDELDTYEIKILKPGYATYSKVFSLAELKQYSTDHVLMITLFEQSSMTGLVGEYLFNGNTDDTSGKNHHGVPTGVTLTNDRRGNPNSAYLFNGQIGDHITIPHNDDMNFSNNQDFTISLWTSVSTDQNMEGIINDIIRKWNGNTEGYPFAIGYINSSSDPSIIGKVMTTRYDGSVCLNVPTQYTPVISTNAYHHIIFQKEGSTLRQYLDNQLVNVFDDYTSCSTTNSANITIGCRGQLARFFSGIIDDVRLFNRAITPSEIDMLFKE